MSSLPPVIQPPKDIKRKPMSKPVASQQYLKQYQWTFDGAINDRKNAIRNKNHERWNKRISNNNNNINIKYSKQE